MVDIKMWLPEYRLDQKAQQQLAILRNHPALTSHIAVMPDAHGGYGVPIGTVIKTQDCVIPNAVGVDIGCGMGVAAHSGEFPMDRDFWLEFEDNVIKNVPVGIGKGGSREGHHAKINVNNWDVKFEKNSFPPEFHDEYPDAFARIHSQIGTLGGGNHFMEVLFDEHGNLIMMVHSGSRGIGAAIAGYFNKRTDTHGIPKDLGVLHADTEEMKQYLKLVNMATLYAKLNRDKLKQQMRNVYAEMAQRYKLNAWAPKKNLTWYEFDVVHNNVFLADGMYVHRKGAAPAGLGVMSVIPGSMGTSSFVVKGLGNPDSYNSSSHGAGRLMGRAAAKKDITPEEFRQSMEGVYTRVHDRNIDESPLAYKDINEVMAQQTDLVEVERELVPLITIKG